MKKRTRFAAGGLACAFLALTLASCSTEDPAVTRVRTAQKAYQAALNSQTAATQTLADATNTLAEDQAELAAVKRSQPGLETAITQAVQNKADGEADYQRRQDATTAAQSALEQVQKEQEEPRKYQNNSLGFFIWNADDSGSDIETITKLFLGQLPASNEVTPNLSSSYDATSYQNFKASLKWIDKCNEMRRRENQSNGTNLKDLPINDWAMASAQLHADYSAYVTGHHGSTGKCKLGFGENLAWSAYGNSADGPFEAWYTQEKKNYKITPEWNGSTGHYLNIVNPDYSVTGYAINTDPNGFFSQCNAQEFAFSQYGLNVGLKTYTTSEYRARISAYEAYLRGLDTTLNAAKKTVSDARSAENTAQKELTRLDAAITAAEKARDDAADRVNTLTEKIKTDRAEVSTAKETLAAAKEAVLAAEQELEDARKALSEQQTSTAKAA